MPSTPVTPNAVSMLWVIRKGTFSGTLKLFPVKIKQLSVNTMYAQVMF